MPSPSDHVDKISNGGQGKEFGRLAGDNDQISLIDTVLILIFLWEYSFWKCG